MDIELVIIQQQALYKMSLDNKIHIIMICDDQLECTINEYTHNVPRENLKTIQEYLNNAHRQNLKSIYHYNKDLVIQYLIHD